MISTLLILTYLLLPLFHRYWWYWVAYLSCENNKPFKKGFIFKKF